HPGSPRAACGRIEACSMNTRTESAAPLRPLRQVPRTPMAETAEGITTMKTLTIDQLREQRQTAQQAAADARAAAATAAAAGDQKELVRQRAIAQQSDGIVESIDEAISQAESN